jgi:hypothetical protein
MSARVTKTWRCLNRGCPAMVRGTSDEATVDAVLRLVAEGHAEHCELVAAEARR